MPTGMVEEMSAEELEKQKPMMLEPEEDADGFYGKCGRCGHRVVVLLSSKYKVDGLTPKWCPACGQRIKRWYGDE